MMGKLKLIKTEDNLYGFCETENIYVNIEKLWDESKIRDPINTEKKFIKEFSNTYTHELLHLIIKDILTSYDYGEEKVIYRLLNEKWTKSVDNYYKNEQ